MKTICKTCKTCTLLITKKKLLQNNGEVFEITLLKVAAPPLFSVSAMEEVAVAVVAVDSTSSFFFLKLPKIYLQVDM